MIQVHDFTIVGVSTLKAPTLKLSQPTWAVNPSVGWCHQHPSSPFIIITQSECWYSFYWA